MPQPLVYELNTRCWLRELAARAGRPVTLANVPEPEFARWQQLGFTHIWLMGVWQNGPRARAQALSAEDQRRHYSEVLPGWTEADVDGSPYAIGDYSVSSALGGQAALQEFRRALGRHGLKLMLDFVPNHLGLDHPWVGERPDLFVQTSASRPETFLQDTATGPRWLAHGKDPYWPAWTDTVQLDYRLQATHDAMTQVLLGIADQCNGVRCDMAMLLLAEVFARTWQAFPPNPASTASSGEFWATAIQTVKKAHPDFVFLAEAYWGLEPQLQALGFDYTYDKNLYDCLVRHDGVAAAQHVLAQPAPELARSAHFLENHDEPRIAGLLSPEEHRAAAFLTLVLPGLRLLHDGQLTGASVRVPVQLTRRPAEGERPQIREMYEQLLAVVAGTAVGRGAARVLRPKALPGERPPDTVVFIQWQDDAARFRLATVNLGPQLCRCSVPLVLDSAPANLSFADRLAEYRFRRSAQELREQGLVLELAPYATHLFELTEY
jgi:hypothetical protein